MTRETFGSGGPGVAGLGVRRGAGLDGSLLRLVVGGARVGLALVATGTEVGAEAAVVPGGGLGARVEPHPVTSPSAADPEASSTVRRDTIPRLFPGVQPLPTT